MSITSPCEVALVYPHQLFNHHPAIEHADIVFLIEDPLFFRQYPFHKKKLVLHRASMKWYASQLDKPVRYIDSHQLEKTGDLQQYLLSDTTKIHVVAPSDYWLQLEIEQLAKSIPYELVWHESPLFYLSKNDVISRLEGQSYLLESFYRNLRKDSGILMDSNCEPLGGQWNFDKQNRKSLPSDAHPPETPKPGDNSYLKEAITYVNHHFADNYGSTDEFFYPVTRPSALNWLDQFLENKFSNFGPYQDAISSTNHTLYHSLLSPLLNIGLLSPDEVISKATDYVDGDVPLNSIEGFIRQILGWREFMHGIYQIEGTTLRNRNFFSHSRSMPDAFWTGTTGIPPVDDTIQFLLQHGYAHHIERLMVLANFMLLCEIKPKEVYRWFMTLFIDAYDWVMVPNVYDMGLFASGGVFATKPYISSSNYIRTMSDYSPGEWSKIWDGLYWRFIDKYKIQLENNHRMGLILAQHRKMSKKKLSAHRSRAKNFLYQL